MAENSRIEWTRHTFNPWVGCSHVSPGCFNCYAEAWGNRWNRHDWQPDTPRVVTSDTNWRQPIKWDRNAGEAGERHRVFCASLADVFDPHAPEGARERLWELIDATPNLDWLLLTKRPNLAARFLPDGFNRHDWPNIWLGFTAEDQEHFDRRWPHIAALDAAVRFVSFEPMLGPLRLDECRFTLIDGEPRIVYPDWIIWGGESGPHARPPEPGWARGITYDCQRLIIPVFGKQWGHYRHNPLCVEGQPEQPYTVAEAKTLDPETMGKGGAMLDGYYWRGVPEAYPHPPYYRGAPIGYPRRAPVPINERIGQIGPVRRRLDLTAVAG